MRIEKQKLLDLIFGWIYERLVLSLVIFKPAGYNINGYRLGSTNYNLNIMKTTSLSIICICQILLSCGTKNEIEQSKTKTEKNIEAQKAILLNKNIYSVREIIGDSIPAKFAILFIYSSNDCESCLSNGFSIISRLDSIFKKQVVYVITSSENFALDQVRNGYENFVFYDENDMIRKELKYIFTPVFIILDSNKTIIHIFYPIFQDNDLEINRFIDYCRNKLK